MSFKFRLFAVLTTWCPAGGRGAPYLFWRAGHLSAFADGAERLVEGRVVWNKISHSVWNAIRVCYYRCLTTDGKGPPLCTRPGCVTIPNVVLTWGLTTAKLVWGEILANRTSSRVRRGFWPRRTFLFLKGFWPVFQFYFNWIYDLGHRIFLLYTPNTPLPASLLFV